MQVMVAGAGPAGLMLAAELALAGVEVAVVDRLPQRSPFCRGFTLNARSLELLDRRGIADRFLAEGPTVPYGMFADPGRPLDLSAMDTDHPYVLGIAQTRVEELLEQWLAELGVPVSWGHEVIDLEQDGAGVDVTVRVGGEQERRRVDYLAGCDGSRSVVRKRAGIGFPGTAATTYGLLADVELANPADLPFGMTDGEHGTVFVLPRPGYVRIVLDEPAPPADRDEPVRPAYFQQVLNEVLGHPVQLRNPRWLTRFSDAARQADRYVAGRVVLAGDAAHIHPPAGAVGVNVALADAVNLGWKLAATALGRAPDGLLDSYHHERHEAGARVLQTTRAQMILARRHPDLDPVRDLFGKLTDLPPVNTYLAELAAGVSTRYDPRIPGAHPWLGTLAPNLKLTLGERHTSVAELLRPARPVFLHLGDRALPSSADGGVDTHHARCPEHAELEGMLIRPDGHTAWISTTTDPQPTDSLSTAWSTWCGAPAFSPPGLDEHTDQLGQRRT
ncbi:MULTISPECIES: FAD-dependent monooxygenase [unclassified Crossiella]|uniref:FAD-dependent monooxygenase n=1 Tax=unclassified Crossiella TaxID=2620835 RepID=UPI001FFF201E|nr:MULTISPECIES: FAD-dependent monooxygenase [unclassified Crossiella]MCK2244377.1 FAD-dependent monooxygenase [Crossiella sp. S99.2]MCK2257795.1 FAD-dependent monooxygenase [Crossiella sp. S99.1]